MSSSSVHLSARQIRGIEKLGDVFAPGLPAEAGPAGETPGLPSFSASGCAREVDRILEHMPESDLKDLKLLLLLLSFLPGFAVAGFVAFLERAARWSGPVGASLRFVRLGIRGLALTLYYSHPQVHRGLGYAVSVYTDDVRGESAGS